MNFKKNFKNAQISIFVVLFLIIVSSSVYFISLDYDEERGSLDKTNLESLSLSSGDFESFKDSINYCLEYELERALITAGLTGGYLNDRSHENIYEKYSESPNFNDLYNSNFLNKFDLNPTYLLDHVLYYSSSEVLVPSLNESLIRNGEVIFTRSIEDDLEEIIRDRLFFCMEIQSGAFNSSGFDLSLGNLPVTVSNKEYDVNEKSLTFELENFYGDVGDDVLVEVMGAPHKGEIIDVDLFNGKYFVKIFEGDLPLNGLLQSDFNFFNLDLGFSLDVYFEDGSVVADALFPVLFEDQGNLKSVEEFGVKINSRYKDLHNLSKFLMIEKAQDRTLDFSDSTQLDLTLSKSSFTQDSIQKYGELGFEIEENRLLNLDEEKHFVYSIDDKFSLIDGRDYRFQFAYENQAPYLDLTQLGCVNFDYDAFDILSDFECHLFVEEGDTVILNLKDSQVLEENQLNDIYQVSFNEISTFESWENSFSLTSDGIFSYTNDGNISREKRIFVTDGETKREYIFRLFSGASSSNVANSDSIGCVSLFNSQDGNTHYDVDSFYENQFFMGSDSDGNSIPFGYMLFNLVGTEYGNEVEANEASFGLRSSCFESPLNLVYDVLIKHGGNEEIRMEGISLNDRFTLDNIASPEPLDVFITVYDQITGLPVLDQPYRFVLFPTTCLNPQNDNFYNCCDLGELDLHREWITSLPDMIQNLDTRPVENPLITQDSIPETLYFAIDQKSDLNPNFAFFNIWGLGDDVTSVFKGNVDLSCDGKYGDWRLNFELTEPTAESIDYTSKISEFILDDSDSSSSFERLPALNVHEFVLEVEDLGSTCHFGGIDDELFSFIDLNGFVWKVGRESLGVNKVALEPNEAFRCDSRVWGKSGYGSWKTGVGSETDFGFTYSYKSYGFCGDDTGNCNKFYHNDYGGNSARYNREYCKQTRFDGDSLETRRVNSGEVCGVDYNSTDTWDYVCNEDSLCVEDKSTARPYVSFVGANISRIIPDEGIYTTVYIRELD